MKKFYLLMGSLAIAASMNAETATMNASELTFDANQEIAGEVITLDSHISLTTAVGGSTDSAKVPLFRKASTSSGTATAIQIYSRNTITITATDATITSVTIACDESTKGTPSWSINVDDADKTLLNTDASTFTFDPAVESTTLTDKSAARITTITVEYTANSGEVNPEEPETPAVDAVTTLISFSDDYYAADSDVDATDFTYTQDGVTLNLKSASTSCKFSKNICYFGSADEFVKLTCRWQSGTKSNGTTTTGSITLPADGTLYVYVRNASDTQERYFTMTQDGKELANVALNNSDAVADDVNENVSYYPVISSAVSKGTVTLGWPTNGVNIYGFKFVPTESATVVDAIIVNGEEGEAVAYDLKGRRVSDSYKGLVIVNGKKYIRK